MSLLSSLANAQVAASVGVIAAILAGIQAASARARWPAGERRLLLLTAALVLTGWFALTFALAYRGAYSGRPDSIPTIQYALLLPIVVGSLFLWRSKTAARLLAVTPTQWLVGVQFFRVLGFNFLILFGLGRLPGAFALPAGIGDVLVGIGGLSLALGYGSNPGKDRSRLRLWNLLGIADLVVAVATGFLTSPSPFQLLSRGAPNLLISAFPLVLIPAFLVPLAILLHLASLKTLRQAEPGEQPREIGRPTDARRYAHT